MGWMMRTVALCTLMLFGTLSGLGQADHEPEAFFKQHMGLQDDQIADIQHGKAVTKALSTSTPAEVVVFGAVYINGSVEDYLKAAQNVNSLRGSPGYLGVQRFSTPPVLADLKEFVLEEEDIKDLKECKPGSCELQLPAVSME